MYTLPFLAHKKINCSASQHHHQKQQSCLYLLPDASCQHISLAKGAVWWIGQGNYIRQNWYGPMGEEKTLLTTTDEFPNMLCCSVIQVVSCVWWREQPEHQCQLKVSIEWVWKIHCQLSSLKKGILTALLNSLIWEHASSHAKRTTLKWSIVLASLCCLLCLGMPAGWYRIWSCFYSLCSLSHV